MNLIFKSMRYIVRFYFHTFFKILGLSHSTFSPAIPFTLHNMDAQGHAPIQPRIDRFSRSLSARAAFFHIASWSNTVNRPSYSISRCYRWLFPSSRRFFPFFSFFFFPFHPIHQWPWFASLCSPLTIIRIVWFKIMHIQSVATYNLDFVFDLFFNCRIEE